MLLICGLATHIQGKEQRLHFAGIAVNRHPMSREQWLLRHRRAERSYPTRSGGVAVRRYRSPKVRSCGCALLEQL